MWPGNPNGPVKSCINSCDRVPLCLHKASSGPRSEWASDVTPGGNGHVTSRWFLAGIYAPTYMSAGYRLAQVHTRVVHGKWHRTPAHYWCYVIGQVQTNSYVPLREINRFVILAYRLIRPLVIGLILIKDRYH